MARFQFPYLSSLLSGRLPYTVQFLHVRYGKVVRIAPNELSFVDPNAWKDIYSRKEFRQPPQWGNRPPGVEVHNLISAPVAEHTRFRKALAPAFSVQAVKAQEPLISSYVDTLMRKLREKAEGRGGGREVDLVA
jgi:cytochrome P450